MLGQCLTMHGGKDRVGTINAATGIQQIDNAHAIQRPLLNLVEVAGVRNQRVVGFLVGPVAHAVVINHLGGSDSRKRLAW